MYIRLYRKQISIHDAWRAVDQILEVTMRHWLPWVFLILWISGCTSSTTLPVPTSPAAETTAWTLAYANDENGVRTEGDIEALITAVQNGQEVRIVIPDPAGYYSTEAENLSVHHGIVYAQNNSHVSVEYQGDSLRFQDDSYYWMIIVSTHGERDTIRWSVGAHEPRGRTQDKVAVRWFVR